MCEWNRENELPTLGNCKLTQSFPCQVFCGLITGTIKRDGNSWGCSVPDTGKCEPRFWIKIILYFTGKNILKGRCIQKHLELCIKKNQNQASKKRQFKWRKKKTNKKRQRNCFVHLLWALCGSVAWLAGGIGSFWASNCIDFLSRKSLRLSKQFCFLFLRAEFIIFFLPEYNTPRSTCSVDP